MYQRVSIIVILFFMNISASIPREIVYQGLLTDQNKVPLVDGDYQITFSLYDAESATTALWTEDQTLKTRQGIFTASIGSTKTGGINIPFNKQYWLGVKTGSKEYSPRVKIGSSAYALRSAVADSVISVDGTLIQAASIDSTKIKDGGICTGDVAASFKAPFAGFADSTKKVSGTCSLSVAQIHVGPFKDSTTNIGDFLLWLNHKGMSKTSLIIGDSHGILNSTGIYLRTGGNAFVGTGPAGGKLRLTSGTFDDTSSRGITVSPTGMIGVGTTTPAYGLDVAGNYGIRIKKSHSETAEGIGLSIESSDASNLIMYFHAFGSASDLSLSLGSPHNGFKDNIIVANAVTGNVGIGTITPKYKLSISDSTTDIFNALRIMNSKSSTTISSGQIARLTMGVSIDPDNDANGGKVFLDAVRTSTNIDFVISLNDVSSAAPVERLHLYGNGDLMVVGGITANGGIWQSSDRRFKTDIISIENPIDKIEMIQGVFYRWNLKEFPDRNFSDEKQIGLIAQDVEKVIPEVVHTDAEGYKSISYDKLTAVLVEAVKEQQKTIKKQQQENSKQNEMIEHLLQRVITLENK